MSRFLLRMPRHDVRDCSFRCLQMLGEKAETARPGDVGAGLVVTCARIAVETVLCVRIEVDLDVRSLGADGLDVAERNAGILFTEMKLGRHLRLVIGEADNGAAVIADRRRQPGQFCCRRMVAKEECSVAAIATSNCGPNRPSSRLACPCGTADRAGGAGETGRCRRCRGTPGRFHRPGVR
jgi:hypothetical protein